LLPKMLEEKKTHQFFGVKGKKAQEKKNYSQARCPGFAWGFGRAPFQ